MNSDLGTIAQDNLHLCFIYVSNNEIAHSAFCYCKSKAGGRTYLDEKTRTYFWAPLWAVGKTIEVAKEEGLTIAIEVLNALEVERYKLNQGPQQPVAGRSTSLFPSTSQYIRLDVAISKALIALGIMDADTDNKE